MKLTRLLTCLLSIMGMSCIQDEAPNAEADILTCTVPADILRRDPIITNDKITLMVKSNTDLSKQSPEFTLTPEFPLFHRLAERRSISANRSITLSFRKTDNGRNAMR